MIWSGLRLSEALGIKINPLLQTGKIQFNSKNIEKGDLFIALKGKGDGHLYAKDAIERGAGAIIVEYEIKDVNPEQTIIVQDTMAALNQLALYKRINSKAKFIGVTGSVGKTTVKETLKLMLSSYGKVFASRGNFNNHLGVPINLASMEDNIDYAIFELGMNHQGEIRVLTNIIKPDIAIITSISEAHMEFFNSTEDIVDAKCEIFEGLNPSGTAIFNGDTLYYQKIFKTINSLKIDKLLTFGEASYTDSKLVDYKFENNKTTIKYYLNAEERIVKLPGLIPKHHAKNFAGCLLVIIALGLEIKKAIFALKNFNLSMGRGKILNLMRKNKKYQIIADYYNASPASVKASLEYLAQINHPNKIIILGDMLELGQQSMNLHQELIPYILATQTKEIFLVGNFVKHIKENLPSEVKAAIFENVEFLIKDFDNLINDNSLIWIKGSRSIMLDKIINIFDQYIE